MNSAGANGDGVWTACDAARPELEALLPALPQAARDELVAAAGAARSNDWPAADEEVRRFAQSAIAANVALSTWIEVAQRARRAIAKRAPGASEAVMDMLDRAVGIVVLAYESRRAELRATAQSHREIIEASPDPVIAMDAAGRVTMFNPAAERLFGYPVATAIGRPLSALVIPPRHREAHERGLQRVIAGAEPRVVGKRIEMPALRADGSEIPVELTITSTKDAHGAVSFTGFLRDLSAHKRAEESVVLWSAALEQAAFGIVVSELKTRLIRRTNASYARMLGYEPGELTGINGDLLLAPGTLGRLPHLGEALANRKHFTYELLLLAKTGAVVPALVSTSTVDVGGQPVLISTVLDNRERLALERQRAEAQVALERQAGRLALLATAAHEFSLATGTVEDLLEIIARRLSQAVGDCCAVRLIGDGPWLAPSHSFYHRDPLQREAMRNLLGARRQALGTGIAGKVAASGEPFMMSSLTPEEMAKLTVAPFKDVVAQLQVTSFLAVPLRSRGRTIGVISLLRSTGSPPFTDEDLTLVQDIGDRAGVALDNVTLLTTLERRVHDRTAKLEAANRELEAFSYSVSHDLRAPLRAIDGFSRALETDYASSFDAEGKRFLDRIRAGTQRMGRLIDDLLALSRIGRRTLEPRELDLGDIAGEIVAELRRRDPDRTVEVSIEPGLLARADARMMAILFENLLGNAWKFTSKTPSPRIEIGQRDGAFFVRDNGAGFDMAYADKLFVPFQRLHAPADFEGVGIGLATVARIVGHHNGRLWAEATVDNGATFFFTLGDPAVTPAAILLVEDNDDDAELAFRAFREAKIASPLVRARDGVEALDYLFARGAHAARDTADLPAVVLLDLNLPRIDGIEVLRALRADARTARLPVVLLTSSSHDRDVLAAYEHRANSFVQKPVNYDEFVAAARQIAVYWTTINVTAPISRT